MPQPRTSDPQRPTRGRRARKVSGDERERAILATLERLLEERSLHEISIDDLARGAGISRPTFYFYFASKEAVLLSLFERMLGEAQATRGDTLNRLAEDPAARLREALGAFFEAFRSRRAVTLAGADAQASSAEVREVWGHVMEAWVAEAAAAIEAERARGAAPPGVAARDLAISLLSMNERVFHTTFARQQPSIAEDDVLDTIVSVWLHAIYGTATPPAAGA
ncbi:MAG TPA: TetR/AcrR family transcriptional regulator [Baekduia sp.]|nr:TetR/AcrR family transcriptional regulator [Baekduia sp.]